MVALRYFGVRTTSTWHITRGLDNQRLSDCITASNADFRITSGDLICAVGWVIRGNRYTLEIWC